MTRTIDGSDISVDIVTHNGPATEAYATVWASEHADGGRTEPVIIKIAGPLHYKDAEAICEAGDFDGDDTMLEWANTQQWTQERHIR